MIDWLKKNKNRLSLRGIEEELGIPFTTLSQATREKNPVTLPKKWIGPLKKFKESLCEDEITFDHPFMEHALDGDFESDESDVEPLKIIIPTEEAEILVLGLSPEEIQTRLDNLGKKPPLSTDTIKGMVSNQKIKSKKDDKRN